MESKQELYKDFEGKKCRIITKLGFTYNTDFLELFEDCVKFRDNRYQIILLDFSEIKFIQEVKNEY